MVIKFFAVYLHQQNKQSAPGRFPDKKQKIMIASEFKDVKVGSKVWYTPTKKDIEIVTVVEKTEKTIIFVDRNGKKVEKTYRTMMPCHE